MQIWLLCFFIIRAAFVLPTNKLFHIHFVLRHNLHLARLRREDMRRGNVRDVHEADGPGGCVFHAAREEIEELEIDGSVHFISYMKSAERVSA